MRQKKKRFEKKRISGDMKDYTIFEEIQIHNREKRLQISYWETKEHGTRRGHFIEGIKAYL